MANTYAYTCMYVCMCVGIFESADPSLQSLLLFAIGFLGKRINQVFLLYSSNATYLPQREKKSNITV